jgi:type 2 lantibiotic biosynthesis protein LanM
VASLTLQERLAASASASPADLTEDTRRRAERFVRWWERTYFPGDPGLFTRRLRAEGLSRRSVIPFVVAGWGRPAGGGPGDWYGGWPLDVPAEPAEPGRPLTFHVAFRPFVRRAWAGVDQAITAAGATCPEVAVDRELLHGAFRDHLNDRLTLIAAQGFTVRLHMARLGRRLGAADAAGRFAQWVQAELADPEALRRLLVDYPVLARAFDTVADGTAAAWSEVVTRLAHDWRELPAALGRLARVDRLIGVSAGLGDSHRGGRSVMSLAFESGWRLVYKPRPMAADAHFQDLLRWLNERGFDPPLRTVAVVDRGSHGWMESVSNEPCTSRAQVDAFYRRQGGLLLVFHLLDATDIHSENLIAAGEHPVPVDLETVLQARPPEAPSDPDPAAVRTRVFHSLVLRTLMLPLPMPGTVGTLDFAALSDLQGQKTPFRVPDWVEPNTDRMRLAYRQMDLDGDKNVPRLDGRVVPATEHAAAVVQGLTDAYRLALRHRDELRAASGPLMAFRDDRIRYLVRPTVEYSLLLNGSYHPSCLQDALQRDLVFDGLWRSTKANPYREPAIASERQDLWNEDIPYFSTTAGGRDLVDSRGRVIPDFVPESGLARALRRLDGFSVDDLERQVACIVGSLAAAAPVIAFPPATAPATEEATPAEMVAAATRVGERLRQLAVLDGDQAHWTGVIQLGGRMVWSPVGPDLYNGTAGIALFLASLARVTGRPEFDALARAAYADVANYLRAPAREPSVGAFVGSPGALYAALHLSHLWDDPAVAGDAVQVLDQVGRRARHVPDMDILDGAAGCILVMLRLASHFPASPALPIAVACGNRLIRQAERVDGALAWTPAWASRPLLGLSHGTAGIAWALAELASATGDRRFLRAARRALAYEEQHFDAAAGNWPDLRDEAQATGSSSVAWCHGAPGAGLARLMLRGHGLDDRELDAGVAVAVSTTERQGFGQTHCLCHGDLGNAELLQLAGDRSGALRRAKAVLDDEQTFGRWRTGATNGAEAPGLMTGLAGIGYGLLRLADPCSVPSVLVLEGPR